MWEDMNRMQQHDLLIDSDSDSDSDPDSDSDSDPDQVLMHPLLLEWMGLTVSDSGVGSVAPVQCNGIKAWLFLLSSVGTVMDATVDG